jgi:aspartate kinase
LKADVVEIFTDVEGVMTADPRLVKDAKVLGALTYREVAEMAHMGAKVIHPRAVEIAMEGRVPLKVRCTMSDAPGTLITDSVGPVDSVAMKGDKVVTGIASISNMALVALSGSQNAGKDPLRVFRVLAEAGVSVDLISVSPGIISFIIKESDVPTAEDSIAKIGLIGTIQKGYAKVSAVGAGMRGTPGVMASVVEALDESGISIYQTTDSHTTISCLVRQEVMADAVRALHTKFNLA